MALSGMEDDEVKEWNLVADVTVEYGTTQVKIPVDNYKEYIICGNIVAESNKTLYVSANREDFDWFTNRIVSLNNGVNTNSSKRFFIKIKKISNDFMELHASAGFEGYTTVIDTMYMREINLNCLDLIEYFWFAASDSSEFTKGNIKIFAR